MNRYLYAAFIFLLTLLAAGGLASAEAPAQGGPAFTATLVMKDGKYTERDKVYFTVGKQRFESGVSDFRVYIVRHDKGVVWTLMPEKKLYVELPIRPENRNPLVYRPDSISRRERVGAEVIDGRPTVKERLVIQNRGDVAMTIYWWYATDLGWPVKAQGEKGEWQLALVDLKPGRPDPSLFELPRGYSKITKKGHSAR